MLETLGAANTATARKHVKYNVISATHIVPVMLETLGRFCDQVLNFVSEIGLRPSKISDYSISKISDDSISKISDNSISKISDDSISKISDDSREFNFLFQKISFLIQHFNKIVFRRTLQDIPDMKAQTLQPLFLTSFETLESICKL